MINSRRTILLFELAVSVILNGISETFTLCVVLLHVCVLLLWFEFGIAASCCHITHCLMNAFSPPTCSLASFSDLVFN